MGTNGRITNGSQPRAGVRPAFGYLTSRQPLKRIHGHGKVSARHKVGRPPSNEVTLRSVEMFTEYEPGSYISYCEVVTECHDQEKRRRADEALTRH